MCMLLAAYPRRRKSAFHSSTSHDHLQGKQGTSPDHLPSSPDLNEYAMSSNLSRTSISTAVTLLASKPLNARSGRTPASAVPHRLQVNERFLALLG